MKNKKEEEEAKKFRHDFWTLECRGDGIITEYEPREISDQDKKSLEEKNKKN